MKSYLFVLLLFPAPLFASQVIANWDVVPYQVISGPMQIGAVAFHETGAKVAFSVNGKEVAVVEEPTLNPRTRVWEYHFRFDPATVEDGEFTLTATAYPDGEGHESRELRPLTFYANSGGGLTVNQTVWADADDGSDESGNGTEASPFASIKKAVSSVPDGGTVYLKAGSYKLTSLGRNKVKRWTTISAAPGLEAEDVQILTYGPDDSSTGRYGRSHIRWHKVSLYCERPTDRYGNIFYFENGMEIWFDGAVLYDAKGRLNNTNPFNGKGSKTYLTDTTLRDVMNAGGGFQRNVFMKNIGSDIYRAHSGLTAINVTIDTIDRGHTRAHPDFFQLHAPGKVVENLIVYNVRAVNMDAQGIFGGGGEIRDAAFVNLLLEKRPRQSYLMSQLSGNWTHILFWNMTMDAQSFFFRKTEHLTEIDIRNCIFSTVSSENPEHRGIRVLNSHFKGVKLVLGENPTRGDPAFLNPEASDYRLTPASPAWQSARPIPGVPADIDGVPYHAKTPNRGAFSSANKP